MITNHSEINPYADFDPATQETLLYAEHNTASAKSVFKLAGKVAAAATAVFVAFNMFSACSSTENQDRCNEVRDEAQANGQPTDHLSFTNDRGIVVRCYLPDAQNP